MINAKESTDVFILDHANIIDLKDENENRAMTDLVNTIRQTALVIKKPVIVVAHVRKSDTRFKTVLPMIEDFHGTSNLVKICTKAVMIGPAYEEETTPLKYPTYMMACKFRKDGSRTRYVAVVNFDISTNSYDEQFAIGELKDCDTKFVRIEDDHKIPYWAKPKDREVF